MNEAPGRSLFRFPFPGRKARVRILLFVLALLLVKSCVIDTYGVRERSMWPRLADRESQVVVDKTAGVRGSAERWDLVVAEKDGKTLVKRLIALGGESVRISGGDVFIRSGDGVETRPARSSVVVEEMRVPVYPSPGGERPAFRVAGPGAARALEGGGAEFVPEEATLKAYVQSPGGGDALRDDHPSSDGRLLRGRRDATDVRAEISGLVRAPGATFAIVHRVAGSVRTLRIGDDGAFLHIHEEERPERDVAIAAAGPSEGLRMETLDGVFRLSVRSGGSWTTAFEEALAAFPSPGPSTVRFDVSGGIVRLRSLVVTRDAHYVSADDSTREDLWFAVPPGEWFLLGDNAPVSTDSRTFGTVKPAEMVGRVIGVFRRPAWAR